MDVEEMQALEDEQREMMEEQMDAQAEAMDYPRARKDDSLFTLFKQVLHQDDSSKVGNLDNRELGMLPIDVRECQRISALSKLLNHKKFALFFDAQAQITLRTSASKKGWFTELFVSQKKLTQRTSRTERAGGEKKQWSMFRKPNREQ